MTYFVTLASLISSVMPLISTKTSFCANSSSIGSDRYLFLANLPHHASISGLLPNSAKPWSQIVKLPRVCHTIDEYVMQRRRLTLCYYWTTEFSTAQESRALYWKASRASALQIQRDGQCWTKRLLHFHLSAFVLQPEQLDPQCW